MPYYTYILQSYKTGKLYIGQTNDLEDRFHRHNTGQNKSTKLGVPWELIYAEKFTTRSEAVVLERKLKSWKSRQRVLVFIGRQSR